MDLALESGMAAAVEANLISFGRYLARSPLIELHESADLTWTLASVPVAFANQVWRAEIEAQRVESRVSEVIQFFESRKAPLRWIVGPGTEPASLGDVLENRGFLHIDSTPGMFIDLAAVDVVAGPVPDLDMVVITDTASLARCLEPMTQGHSMPESAARFFLEVYQSLSGGADRPWVLYLGLHQEKPVALSASFLSAGVAGVYSVATVPGARRQGIASAMTRLTLEQARARGCRSAVLRSSAAAIGLYRALGFRECCRFRDYVWTPASG